MAKPIPGIGVGGFGVFFFLFQHRLFLFRLGNGFFLNLRSFLFNNRLGFCNVFSWFLRRLLVGSLQGAELPYYPVELRDLNFQRKALDLRVIEFGDGAEAYQYNDTKTVELQLPDGTKLVEFADGQKEKHMTNGDKEITFPNGTVKLLHPNGEFEILSSR